MTHRDTLYANYEDALFALMMDSVVQSEGKRLLAEKERLEQDPDAALSEALQRRCMKTIDRAFAKQKRRAAGRTAKKVFKLLPLVAVIIAAMAVLAYAAFPEFRADVLNLLLRNNTGSIDWSFVDNKGIDAQSDIPESPTFTVELPAGYELSEYWYSSDMEQADYRSKITEDGRIIISVLHGENAATNTDIQEADYYEQTSIQGYDAVLTIKDGLICIVWGDPDIQCYVALRVTEIDSAVAKQIAESVVVQELQKN